MKITKLNLLNFRNYEKAEIKLGNNMNIIIGNNAQGKTNVLEAISILALTKSHRNSTIPNLIKIGKKKTIIKGNIKKDKLLTKLQVEISDNNKLLKINNSDIKKVSDYISNLNVIIFTPDDLEIIKGSPNIRRNLLNIQLSQISKTYLNTYNEYNKLLKTRNEYLKILFNNSIADINYLDILTEKLVEKAIIIYQMRKEYLDNININLNKYYCDIVGEDGIIINYEPNIDLDNYDSEIIRKKMIHIFKKNYKKELNYGMTLYGPHRDDFVFIYNNMDLKYYGSQGQQKVAILSFKLSEIYIFEKYCKTSPIILLDDIFSELDIRKRNKLLKLISKDIQSIITTTDLKSINKKFLSDAYIFNVDGGNIIRK